MNRFFAAARRKPVRALIAVGVPAVAAITWSLSGSHPDPGTVAGAPPALIADPRAEEVALNHFLRARAHHARGRGQGDVQTPGAARARAGQTAPK